MPDCGCAVGVFTQWRVMYAPPASIVCLCVRRSWRGSGASARVGGGLTVRLCDCYRYVIGKRLCPRLVGRTAGRRAGFVERVDGVVFW